MFGIMIGVGQSVLLGMTYWYPRYKEYRRFMLGWLFGFGFAGMLGVPDISFIALMALSAFLLYQDLRENNASRNKQENNG